MKRLLSLWCWVVGHRPGQISEDVRVIALKKQVVFSADCQRCGTWIVCGVEVTKKQEVMAPDVSILHADIRRASHEAIAEKARGHLWRSV